jgi:hypothetical protein
VGSSNLLATFIPLTLQSLDFSGQSFHVFTILGIGGAELGKAAFLVPEADLLNHVVDSSLLGKDLLTGAAVFLFPDGVIVELHATCFANAIFFAALAPEISPLPAIAGITDAVVETHYDRAWTFLGSCISLDPIDLGHSTYLKGT